MVRGRGGNNTHVTPLVRNFLHVIFGSGWLLKERFMLDKREVVRPFLNQYDLVLGRKL